MKVLLAGPDHEDNLSLRYLSASLLNAGHDTVLAPFNSPADTMAVADAAKDAGIAGLSMCFQSRAMEFLHLARLIKSRDPEKLIVAGGHHASCAAAPLLANHPEIDIIVIHEGERTLVEIADAMPHLKERLAQIPGVAYRDGQKVRFTRPRPTLDDLDALPFPDRRGPVHMIAGVPTSYLMGSRGCYGNCAYCCITTLHRMAPGRRFRQRNVERIADEMAELYHGRGVRQFVFHDDNFLVPSKAINHARVSAFEKALKQRRIERIALVIKCRPVDADREILRRLKGLGLVRVFLGIESATARGLSSLERKQSVADSERALETCAQLDISAQFTLMVFNPDATLDTLRSDVAFMRRFCSNPLNFCRAEIYMGTPLEKRMIELGRARGDYLAREYNLSDPVADLACSTSLDLFDSRCWSNGSLMQNAIGLDHIAAVVRRFYDNRRQAAVCENVASWLRSVNLDTIDLLEEVVELSACFPHSMDASFQRAMLAVTERESTTRQRFLSEASSLRAELETFRFPDKVRQSRQISRSSYRLARQATAAFLAIGMPAASGWQPALGQQVKAPPSASAAGQDSSVGSLAGTVTDSSGAAVAKATITIANVDTRQARMLTTNDAGQYTADHLQVGNYSVTASKQGFESTTRTGIMLRPGTPERVDIRLEVEVYGCCEYAAVPLHVLDDWSQKKRPFTYVVGSGEDHNSFQGIAKLVYRDPKAWVAIFEANREKIEKPEFIPNGTEILIPKGTRTTPKLISNVMPAYPDAARKAGVSGDVVMDVSLKEDGSVAQVDVIDGPTLLNEAATTAVKQWRYQPSPQKNKPPIRKFVVVISFGKGGKIQ